MRARTAILLILAAVALLGTVAGWRFARLSPGDLAMRAGADWMARGGSEADCTALADAEPAWVSVICGSGADGLLYQFDRFGRMTASPLADPADATRPEA